MKKITSLSAGRLSKILYSFIAVFFPAVVHLGSDQDVKLWHMLLGGRQQRLSLPLWLRQWSQMWGIARRGMAIAKPFFSTWVMTWWSSTQKRCGLIHVFLRNTASNDIYVLWWVCLWSFQLNIIILPLVYSFICAMWPLMDLLEGYGCISWNRYSRRRKRAHDYSCFKNISHLVCAPCAVRTIWTIILNCTWQKWYVRISQPRRGWDHFYFIYLGKTRPSDRHLLNDSWSS